MVAGVALAGSAYGLDISRVRRDGGAHGAHHGDHGAHHSAPAAVAPPAASSGYSAPATGYEEPQTGYEQPTAPQTGYEQPAYASGAGYAATAVGSGYGASAPAPLEAGGFDLTQLLIPILIIAGLALLFPSVTTVAVNAARKKREVAEGEEAGGLSNVIERVQDIYMAVLESEECMERVACEVGGLAEDAGLPKTVFHLAEPYVPKKYSKFVKKFNSAKDCHKIKCGNFF
jgi:hypothetical protein